MLGSVNLDYVIRVNRRPRPGETVSDGVLDLYGGGKGANQAVAAVLSGANVELIARVGNDEAGNERIAELMRQGVGTTFVLQDASARTGAAFVTITPNGENSIATALGANDELSVHHVQEAASIIKHAKVLVTQLEVPVAAVVRSIELTSHATTVILNYSPFAIVPSASLKRVNVLVVNGSEAMALTGQEFEDLEGAFRAGEAICDRGPSSSVITLGAKGAVLVSPEGRLHVPAPQVHAVDSTGAGDAFVGVLSAQISAGKSLVEAVALGVIAGSASTELPGANPVVPTTARLTSESSRPRHERFET